MGNKHDDLEKTVQLQGYGDCGDHGDVAGWLPCCNEGYRLIAKDRKGRREIIAQYVREQLEGMEALCGDSRDESRGEVRNRINLARELKENRKSFHRNRDLGKRGLLLNKMGDLVSPEKG